MASSDIKNIFFKILKKAPLPAGPRAALFYLLAPAAVTFAQLYYIRSAHSYLLYLLPLPAWAAAAAAVPLLVLEYAATRKLEAKRLGPGPLVWLPMAGRMLVLLLLSVLFFLFPITAHGRPDIFAPLVGLWHFVGWIMLYANPLPAAVLLALIGTAYWALVYRRSAFRLTVTLLLPAAGAAALFSLLYFYPGGPLRELRSRPAGLEKIFPAEGYAGADGEPWPAGTLYPHEVYAAPDDSWAALSFGATFGRDAAPRPTFAWVDLLRPEFRAFHEGSQVRRFSSECPGRLYFAPWHAPYLLEYVPGADSLRRLPLPAVLGGWPVEELFAVHNACGKVYAVNNLNPALFALDGSGKLLKSLSLHEAGLIGNGAVVFQVKRNPRRRTLLVSLYGQDPAAKPGFWRLMWFMHWIGVQPGRRILEFDENTLQLTGASDPSRAFMDLALSPDGRRLYAPSVFTQDIYMLDAENLKIIGKIDAPFHVRKLEFSADGKFLYAGSYLGGDVVVYEVSSSKRLGSFYVTPRIEGLSATKKYLYAAGAGGLFRISNDKIIPALGR